MVLIRKSFSAGTVMFCMISYLLTCPRIVRGPQSLDKKGCGLTPHHWQPPRSSKWWRSLYPDLWQDRWLEIVHIYFETGLCFIWPPIRFLFCVAILKCQTQKQQTFPRWAEPLSHAICAISPERLETGVNCVRSLGHYCRILKIFNTLCFMSTIYDAGREPKVI